MPMSSSTGPRSATFGWLLRQEKSINEAKELLRRGLRSTVVSSLTGIPLESCQSMRAELLPNAKPTRAQLPAGIESRCLRTRKVYRTGSIFLAAYLSIEGRSGAAQRVRPSALCAAYDFTLDVCELVGWEPLPFEYAYVIARELSNPEGVLVERCRSCSGPFLSYQNTHFCPACSELGESPVEAKRKSCIQ